MKAVILAAGKGTRMGELTNALPKPMLKVDGVPILEHILRGIRAAGIESACVITGWRAEAIEDYFEDGSRCGMNIEYVRQETQDGTGKAPELAKDFVGDDDFLLTYGDILVPPATYARMVERFQSATCTGLLTVTEGEDVKKGAILFFDEQFFLKGIVEKPSEEQLKEFRNLGWIREGGPVWYNAGIYMFAPKLFAYTACLEKSPRGEYELTDAIRMMIEQRDPVAGLKIEGRWVDVRDPEVLKSLNEG